MLSIVYVHIGAKPPEYLWDSVAQARRFTLLPIYLILPEETRADPRIRKFRCIFFPVESLFSDPLNRELDSVDLLRKRGHNNFWHFALQRLIIIGSFLEHYCPAPVIHIENDNAIYRDPLEMEGLFHDLYTGKAAFNPVGPQHITAGYTYIDSHEGIQSVNRALLNLLSSKSPSIFELLKTDQINIMLMLSLLHRTAPGLFGLLPLLPKEPISPYFDRFLSLFDCASWSHYAGGTPLGYPPGTTIENHWVGKEMLAGKYKLKWYNDEQGRSCPFVESSYDNVQRWRLNNLHIHCKRVRDFMFKESQFPNPLSNHTDFPSVNLPHKKPTSIQCWCGGQTGKSSHEFYGKCVNCGTLISKMVYSKEELKRFYGMEHYWHKHQIEKSHTPPIEQRMIEDFHNRIPLWYRILNRYKLLPDRILEIGCSHGGFLHYCLTHGIREAIGIEIDENTCRLGRNIFGLEHIIAGLFPDIKLPYKKFDAICAFDVLEHFHEPSKALKSIAEHLNDDGICIIQTPNYRGDGASWEMFLPDEHLYLYNETSVRKLIETSGLQTVQILPGLFHYDMFVVAKKAGSTEKKTSRENNRKSTIVIDGVIFQLQAKANYGIARIWKNIVPIMQEKMSDSKIVLLIRGNYNPGIKGIETHTIPEYCSITPRDIENDEKLLTAICHEFQAEVFLSTYYSSAPAIKTIQLVYDLIPELFKANMFVGMWASKTNAFSCAHQFITISESTKSDLTRYYHEPVERVTVAYPGVSEVFKPAPQKKIAEFKEAFGITRPYFILVGRRSSYKNGTIVLQSFVNSDLSRRAQIVCIGGEPFSDTERADFDDAIIRIDYTDDETLSAAYSGARAFIYPSLYEGFGIPIAEAGACGCPVITCRNSSLPEVGADACVYIDPKSEGEIINAMHSMLNDATRSEWGEKGIPNAARFTWDKMADKMRNEIIGMLSRIQKSSRVLRFKKMISFSESNFHIDKNKALRASLIAASICTTDHRPFLLAARVCRETGDVSGATMHYSKALALCPVLKTASLEYADFYREQEKYGDALRIIYELTDHYPDDPDIFSNLQHTLQLWLSAIKSLSIFSESAHIPSEPLISVVVSTYNSEAFIDECLSDLVKQSVFNKIEVIIIDAASPQDEKGIVQRYIEKYPGIRYYRTAERIGIYAAWNLGIYLASGKYVFMFSTNDRLRPDTLEILSVYLESNPGIDLVYGNTYLTDVPHSEYGKHIPSSKHGGALIWPDYSFYRLMFSCQVGPHPMWRRSVHKKIGYFDFRYRAIGDQDFWLKLGRKGKLAHINEFTGLQWLTKDSLSGDHSSMKEVFEIHTKHQRIFLHSQNTCYTRKEYSYLLSNYTTILVVLVKANKINDAIRFRDTFHSMFPPVRELMKLDTSLIRLKNKMMNRHVK